MELQNQEKMDKQLGIKKSITYTLIILICSTCNLYSQELRFAFYNTENFFDTVDNPTASDDQFTPWGDRAWNSRKYREKLVNISRVIYDINPDIIGLCEIESKTVTDDLVDNTRLSDRPLRIIHDERDSHRKLETVIIYDSSKMTKISHNYRTVELRNIKTRDILIGVFKTAKQDTLAFIVNHWPSRYGGVTSSNPQRAKAAKTLNIVVDSLESLGIKNIIITGDFNDSPKDRSIAKILIGENSSLVNISSESQGTIRYRGDWNIFDQFIITKKIYQKNNINTTLFCKPYLLEKDSKYLGSKPKRSYIGYQYQNGFSDHLPIYIDITL